MGDKLLIKRQLADTGVAISPLGLGTVKLGKGRQKK
jgi:aryl-alcohol dehydrogenase-like predicted oxidoreductase